MLHPGAPSGHGERSGDRQRTARVLRVAMRTAVAMLSSGAQSDEVEAIAVAVASAFGLHGVQAAVTFSTITLSHDASDLESPTTLLHIVRDRTSDFGRLAAAASLARGVRDGTVTLEDAEAALDSLEEQPLPYGALVSFVAPGVSAAASTIVFGGNLVDAAATMLIALIVQPGLSGLDRSTLPPFFRVVFGAAASALLVAVIVKLGVPITGGLVLTGSLLRFLPGYALVSGFRDLIDQSMISGSARLAEALLLAAGVAGGTLHGTRRGDEVRRLPRRSRPSDGPIGATSWPGSPPSWRSAPSRSASASPGWFGRAGGRARRCGLAGVHRCRRRRPARSVAGDPRRRHHHRGRRTPARPPLARRRPRCGSSRRSCRCCRVCSWSRRCSPRPTWHGWLGAPGGGRDGLPRRHRRRLGRHPGPWRCAASVTTWSLRRSTP